MDLLTFLTQESPFDQHSVYCFVGTHYPSFLFSFLKQNIKKKRTVITIDTLDDKNDFKAHLEMSFLGSQSFYWISQELIETHKEFIPYLSSYKGPHTIGFFSKKPLTENSNAHSLTIDIPPTIHESVYTKLFTLLYPRYVKKSSAITQAIYTKHQTISLDAALLIMQYCILLGNKTEPFVQEWIPSIIVPEKSLFTLSAHFFAKKERLFFELWHTIASDYSDPFWTTFWSEQLFKAHAFISLHTKQQFSQAKKVAYRLPFSFIQKDWKLISDQELCNAHNHLYAIDWNTKNGIPAYFEHFYLNFFFNRFKNAR